MMTYDELQQLADYMNTLLPWDHQITLFPWDPNHEEACLDENECLLTHYIPFLTKQEIADFEEPFATTMTKICWKYYPYIN